MKRKSILKSCLFSVFIVCFIHFWAFLPNVSFESGLSVPFAINNDFLFQALYWMSACVSGILIILGGILLVYKGRKELFSGISAKMMFYTLGLTSALHFLLLQKYLGATIGLPDGTVVHIDSYHAFLVMLGSFPDILLECAYVVLFVSSFLCFLIVDAKPFFIRCGELAQVYPRRAAWLLSLFLLWAGYWVIIGAGRLWGTTSFLLYRPAVPGGAVIGIWPEQNSPEKFKALVLAYILAAAVGLFMLTLTSGALLLWTRRILVKTLAIRLAVSLGVPAFLLYTAETVWALFNLAPGTYEASFQVARIMCHFPAVNVYVMFLALLFSSTVLCLQAKNEKKPTTLRVEHIPEAQ